MNERGRRPGAAPERVPPPPPPPPPWFDPQIHSGTRMAEAILRAEAGPFTVDDLGDGLAGWRCHLCPQYRAAYGSRDTAEREALTHQEKHR